MNIEDLENEVKWEAIRFVIALIALFILLTTHNAVIATIVLMILSGTSVHEYFQTKSKLTLLYAVVSGGYALAIVLDIVGFAS